MYGRTASPSLQQPAFLCEFTPSRARFYRVTRHTFKSALKPRKRPIAVGPDQLVCKWCKWCNWDPS